MGSIPEPGRSPGGGHRNPLQCSCLEIAMDRGAWWAIAYGVGLQQVRHDWSNSTHVRSAFTYEKWFFKPDCFCRWVRKEQQSLRTLYNTVFKMQNWEGFEPVLKLLSAVLCLVAQSYPTPRDPMDCSPPGSSVYGEPPGENTGVGCHALLQEIFPIQGLNPGLPYCGQILYCLSHQGSPRNISWKENK